MDDLSKRLRDAATYRETVTPDEHGARVLSGYLAQAQALMSEAADALDARWQPMDTAPKDKLILVWFDHDADPYFLASAQAHPTDYAFWAECTGEFLEGSGVAFAKWQNPVFEAKDDYGGGTWLPAWWCAYENGYYERAVNPLYWQALPPPPEGV